MTPPFSLQKWISENRDKLKPPVGNYCLWDNSGFLVMVIGGPNARTDYHINPGEELFYQVEGDITVRIQENGQVRDVPIRQGEIFLLPPRVPHSPQRGPNTVGLVVEFPKAQIEDHHLQWFCQGCNQVVCDFPFRPVDLGKQITAMITRWNGDAALRTCKACGKTN